MKRWVWRGIAAAVVIALAAFLVFTFAVGYGTPGESLVPQSQNALAAIGGCPADKITPTDQLSYGNTCSLLFTMPDGSTGYAIWQKRLWDTQYKPVRAAVYTAPGKNMAFTAEDYLCAYLIQINGAKLQALNTFVKSDVLFGCVTFALILVAILCALLLKHINKSRNTPE